MGKWDLPAPADVAPELLAEARGWLGDCWGAETVADLTDSQVIAGVQWDYEGGWAAFTVACADLVPAVVAPGVRVSLAWAPKCTGRVTAADVAGLWLVEWDNSPGVQYLEPARFLAVAL